MARNRRRPSPGPPNIWPGFTDALAGLVVALVFLLVLFFLFEVVLSRQVSGQEEVIDNLRGQVERLADLLGASQQRRQELQATLEETREKRQGLQARVETLEERRQRLREELETTREAKTAAEEELAAARRAREETAEELTATRTEAEAAAANVQALTEHVSRLNRRLDRLEKALALQEKKREAAEARAEKLEAEVETQQARMAEQQSRIEVMAARIRTELLERVETLEQYRSEFFGRLRDVFADRPDIKIRGDRFVFQSEILFASGKAELTPGGRSELQQFVDVYSRVADQVPEGIDMIIMVEGHTDRVPIRTAQFRSNWELSTARALSVVHFLIDRGIPSRRLAATGYGEYHPITPGRTPEERRQNRRIELKITQR